MKKVSIMMCFVTVTIFLTSPCHGDQIQVGELSSIVGNPSENSEAFMNNPMKEWVRIGHIFSNHFLVSMKTDEHAEVNPGRESPVFTPIVSRKVRGAYDRVNLSVGSVPEPSTLLLLGAGLVGFASFYRRTLRR